MVLQQNLKKLEKGLLCFPASPRCSPAASAMQGNAAPRPRGKITEMTPCLQRHRVYSKRIHFCPAYFVGYSQSKKHSRFAISCKQRTQIFHEQSSAILRGRRFMSPPR
jgi:hypothetical protein